jgi:toxin ParE1/3/4
MRRTRIVWTVQAKLDLKSIQRYIARDAPRDAPKYVKRLKAAVEILKDFPEMGGLLPESEETGHRELVHGNYRLIYRYTGTAVLVVAVVHGAKLFDPDSIIE